MRILLKRIFVEYLGEEIDITSRIILHLRPSNDVLHLNKRFNFLPLGKELSFKAPCKLVMDYKIGTIKKRLIEQINKNNNGYFLVQDLHASQNPHQTNTSVYLSMCVVVTPIPMLFAHV